MPRTRSPRRRSRSGRRGEGRGRRSSPRRRRSRGVSSAGGNGSARRYRADEVPVNVPADLLVKHANFPAISKKFRDEHKALDALRDGLRQKASKSPEDLEKLLTWASNHPGRFEALPSGQVRTDTLEDVLRSLESHAAYRRNITTVLTDNNPIPLVEPLISRSESVLVVRNNVQDLANAIQTHHENIQYAVDQGKPVHFRKRRNFTEEEIEELRGSLRGHSIEGEFYIYSGDPRMAIWSLHPPVEGMRTAARHFASLT